MVWKPDVTVAAIAERDGRFLMVEERSAGRIVVNQPAGHLEDGESLTAAIIRETLEETTWHFRPDAVVGVYLWRPEHGGRSFLRVTFCGELLGQERDRTLDRGILRTRWMNDSELMTSPRLRSPLVARCVEDYRRGQRFPLSVLCELIAEPASVIAASG